MTENRTITLTIKNLVIGHIIDNGQRQTMTINVTLHQQPGDTPTVDHTTQKRSLRLSITGNVHHGRHDISSGQISSQIGDISELASDLTVADLVELQRLWQRWHLNHMRAWSREMFDRVRAANFDYDRCSDITDSHGYVYGRAFLEEPLVRSEMESLINIIDKARGHKSNPTMWHIADTIDDETLTASCASINLDGLTWEA